MTKAGERRRRNAGDGKRLRTVEQLTFEVALLYLRMRAAANDYLGQGRHSAGRRSVLKELGREGPRTVPEMARSRAVSRQHVQTLVDELRRDELVRSDPHPDDRRTRVIALTARGRELLATIDRSEAALLAFVADGISAKRLEDAAAVVRGLRERLESPAWQELIERD